MQDLESIFNPIAAPAPTRPSLQTSASSDSILKLAPPKEGLYSSKSKSKIRNDRNTISFGPSTLVQLGLSADPTNSTPINIEPRRRSNSTDHTNMPSSPKSSGAPTSPRNRTTSTQFNLRRSKDLFEWVPKTQTTAQTTVQTGTLNASKKSVSTSDLEELAKINFYTGPPLCKVTQ
jgi:hypothetical protein